MWMVCNFCLGLKNRLGSVLRNFGFFQFHFFCIVVITIQGSQSLRQDHTHFLCLVVLVFCGFGFGLLLGLCCCIFPRVSIKIFTQFKKQRHTQKTLNHQLPQTNRKPSPQIPLLYPLVNFILLKKLNFVLQDRYY